MGTPPCKNCSVVFDLLLYAAGSLSVVYEYLYSLSLSAEAKPSKKRRGNHLAECEDREKGYRILIKKRP